MDAAGSGSKFFFSLSPSCYGTPFSCGNPSFIYVVDLGLTLVVPHVARILFEVLRLGHGREALRKPKSSSVITNHHLCCSWTWNHADEFTLSNPQHPALRFVLFLLINTWHSSKTEKKARNAIKGFDQIQLQPSTDTMEGGDGGRQFLDSDGDSDDETFERFHEHNYSVEDDMPLQHCNFVNDDLISMEPSTGMTFQSLDDARDFYYEYAKRTGFTIRTNRIRHSLKNMAIIGRDFVCSREGFRAAKHTLRKDRVLPPRPITREGCKAMIRLAARDEGRWIVTKFIREHNHKLMAHCKFPGELPIINILSEVEKDKKIQDLYDELQRERERSAAFQQQLCMILKDLEEHAEYISVRVEDIVKSMKEIELRDL
ncbi:unnamed protein product [Prunus armeniaca]|uniref:FAR1 domain-containing protein n=1 Tax=Prunus armeniaca TaxID=36596 RepID=A0A6J5TI46_PRUAR|nr:unnamed protein product [Prunus armeniaca]